MTDKTMDPGGKLFLFPNCHLFCFCFSRHQAKMEKSGVGTRLKESCLHKETTLTPMFGYKSHIRVMQKNLKQKKLSAKVNYNKFHCNHLKHAVMFPIAEIYFIITTKHSI